MIIKFLPHGKGDPFRAAAYVMDDKDHLNLPRTGVEVLRGDPMTFELINQFIEHRMLQGVVYDRPTVLQALSEIGTITRVGQNYISLRTEAGTDRLKAAYYDEQFYLSDYLENQRRRDALGSPSIEDSRKLAERTRALREAEQRIQDVRTKRQQYNERTYRDPEPLSAAISDDQRIIFAVEPAVEEVTTLQDPSRGGERTAEQSDGGNTLTDAKPSTNPFGDIADIRKSPENAFQFFDLKRITTQGDQSTTQDEARSQYHRGDSARYRQNTYLHFSAIADTDLQQQSHFNLQQHKRYLNARIPYRVTTPDSAATPVVTTRKSSFEKLLARDEGRDQRSQQYHRIAASLSRQIATIDRTIEQRATAQKSADPAVSELFIQQHRRTKSNRFIQYLGAVVERVSEYLSPIRTVSNAVSELYRGKAQQLFEQFRDATYDQLVKFAISREKHRKRVGQCAERSHEYEQRFKQTHQFISTALDWSIQRIFPKDNLSHFIRNIVQQHPDQDFTMMRVYAERVDDQITDHIRFLIDENKKGNRYPTEEKLKFAREFRLCTEKLIQNIHLFKKDDPNILGFLNTMDHYMQMIDLNHSRPHLNDANSHLINANDASRLDIKDGMDELRSYLEPYDRKKSDEQTERNQDMQIVPKTPEPKRKNLRDLEL